MKYRICPNKDACWAYDASNCEGCAVGEKIAKQARQIKKLKVENKKLCERLAASKIVPCKVGDTLYEPFTNLVREWEVESIYVFSLGINVCCHRKDDCRWHDHFAIREISNDFGTRVFVTREAAKVRLKEENAK